MEVIGAIHECGAALALPTTTVLQATGTPIGASSPYTEHTAAKSGIAGSNINPYRVDSSVDSGNGNGDGVISPTKAKSIKSTLRSEATATGREEEGVNENSSAPTAMATISSSQDDDVALAEAMELAEALMDYTDGSLSSPATPLLSASDVPMSE